MTPTQTTASGPLPILLVFLPSAHDEPRLKTDTLVLLKHLQTHLADRIELLSIDPDAHNQVTLSFQVTQTPTLILLHRGVELWRQTGLTEQDSLSAITHLL